MSNFNQLRQNVRNYCVGLTADEIRREIEACKQQNNKTTMGKVVNNRRISYFQEYLAELEKENNDTRTNSSR